MTNKCSMEDCPFMCVEKCDMTNAECPYHTEKKNEEECNE